MGNLMDGKQATTSDSPPSTAGKPGYRNDPKPSLSQHPKAWVTIAPELCKGCELCVYACPSGNLTLSSGLNAKGYHPAVFAYQGERGSCTACGICYWVCPDMAVSEIRRLRQ